MNTIISNRHIKAWQKFNAELEAFAKITESGLGGVMLYEDAYTTREVRDFSINEKGELSWNEDGLREIEQMCNEDEAKDYLSFWRANLRRAKKYWAMDSDLLDKIQDGEIDDID